MATGIGERGFVALDDAHNNGLPITLVEDAVSE